MSQPDISCGLEYSTASDISVCLKEALHYNYSFVVLPIIHPRFRRHHVRGVTSVPGFTRSDMLLSPQDWTVRIVGKISPYLDLDAPSQIVSQKHEDCLNEELAYYRGLGLPAVMLTLRSRETTNLTRLLNTYFANSQYPSLIWVRVPMISETVLRERKCTEEADDVEDDQPWNEPWQWWSLFHERMEWDKRVGVVLEISADLPPPHILKRWLGEPVKAILLSTNIFHSNKKGYPVLSRAHQQVVRSMVEHEAQVIITGGRHSNTEYYAQYLHRLWRRCQPDDPMLSYARGWEDYIQTPLQPLADNLDTHTYNVFEKDPVKYDQYQKAISHALIDLHKKECKINCPHRVSECKNHSEWSETMPSENEKIDDASDCLENLKINDYLTNGVMEDWPSNVRNVEPITDKCDTVFTVMVLGAGRGPLVRATLNAAEITKSNVKVVAIEKNPCAIVVLMAQVKEVWHDRDVVVLSGDMRHIKLPQPADIIVSELLGSWADNELSPECLDGAASLLRSGGISIPSCYTSYAAPISSARLWAAAKAIPNPALNQQEKNLETLWVVYMQNKYNISEKTQAVFTFRHPSESVKDGEGNDVNDYKGLPASDNRRSTNLSWTVEQDSVVHGFGGYFDCTLYGSEMISIVPSTHSPGMISWFPVFIPIKTPLRVHKGDVIKATFWRCVSPRRVWYEWMAQVGSRVTPLHNPNGRSSEMLL